MLNRVLLVVVVGVCVAPPSALALWPSVSHYIDYVVAKNCFGETLAMKLERTGLELGRECWSKEWDGVYGFPRELPAPPASTKPSRTKRNLFKMPSSPTTSLQICNLKAWNLLTPEYEVNYKVVDDFLKSGQLDEDLGTQFLELSKTCQSIPVPPAPLMPSGKSNPMLKGLAAFKIYMDCMNTNGMKICMAREQEKLQEMMIEGKMNNA